MAHIHPQITFWKNKGALLRELLEVYGSLGNNVCFLSGLGGKSSCFLPVPKEKFGIITLL